MDQDAGCSCRNCGLLLAVSDSCGLVSSAAQRFSPKFISDANSDRFSNTGFCPKPQSYSYRDSEGADSHQSQPYSESNPHSECNSDANAARLSKSECLADSHTHAFTRISLGAFV
jgi:hypothetical protein